MLLGNHVKAIYEPSIQIKIFCSFKMNLDRLRDKGG